MPNRDSECVASSRRTTKVSATRIDAAHSPATQPAKPAVSSAERATPPAAGGNSIGVASIQNGASSEIVSQQLRTQAEQLRCHLHAWQEDLDQREALIDEQSVRLESDSQTARLWLDQRVAELDDRDEQLGETERELRRQSAEMERQRRELLARREELDREQRGLADQQATIKAAREELELDRRKIEAAYREIESHQHRREMIRRAAAILESRYRHLAEAETRLAKDQATAQRLQRELLEARRNLQQEEDSRRRRFAVENRHVQAEPRCEAGPRSRDIDECRTALEKLRRDVTRPHPGASEILAATEELWSQLSGAALPPTLARGIREIRGKLTDASRRASDGLEVQEEQIENVRLKMLKECEKLAGRRGQLEQWVERREEEIAQQTARLAAREEQLRWRETEADT